MRRATAIKDGDTVVGNRTKIKVVKNKVAAPFRDVEVDILYGAGISREADLLDFGAAQGVVEKSGSWFSYGGERIGQGRDNARIFLLEHTDIRQRLESEVRAAAGLSAAGVSTPGPGLPAAETEAAPKPARAAGPKVVQAQTA